MAAPPPQVKYESKEAFQKGMDELVKAIKDYETVLHTFLTTNKDSFVLDDSVPPKLVIKDGVNEDIKSAYTNFQNTYFRLINEVNNYNTLLTTFSTNNGTTLSDNQQPDCSHITGYTECENLNWTPQPSSA